MSKMNQLPEEAFDVLRGNPTPEELATVIAVLQVTAEAAAAAHTETKPVSSWARNVAMLRVPVSPGRGQWGAAYRRGLNR